MIMKNSWLLICSMLLLLFVACSDDDDDNVIPELPDSDMDISVPERPAEWVPGMPFAPYPGMPAVDPGERVYMIIVDAEEHGRKIMEVLNNRGWAWNITEEDRKNIKQCFFPTHSDIDLYLTETYDFDNSEHLPCDIISASISSDNY